MEQKSNFSSKIKVTESSSIIACKDGGTIAYELITGNSPGVIFLPGLKSDMTGTKANAFYAFCKEKNQAYLRFDYRGHGASSGNFEEFTIGDWLEDVIHVIDSLTFGPQVIIGSSMGGWLMLLAALRRPGRIVGLIGLAAAPDFTEELIWEKLDKSQRGKMKKLGFIDFLNCYDLGSPFRITYNLVKEGRNHLLLKKNIPIDVPVHFIHGMKDTDVPYIVSERAVQKINSRNVNLTLIKSGDHRLSREIDIKKITNILTRLLNDIKKTTKKY